MRFAKRLSVSASLILAISLYAGCKQQVVIDTPPPVAASVPEAPAAPAVVPPVAIPAPAVRPYEAFLMDVVDLDKLTEPPVPGATCKQHSSYDRMSTIDPTGQFLQWGANKDFGNYIRIEESGKECVMAEMEGPGAIVRVWSANPGGNLRVYIDDAAEPVLDVPFADLCGGKVAGVPEPLVGFHARGANCWLPMPYQKKCRVTCAGNPQPERMYYYVDYWTYPADTQVESFKWPLSDKQAAVLATVCARLTAPDLAPPSLLPAAKKSAAVALEAGKTTEITKLSGPGRITILKVKIDLPGDQNAAAAAPTVPLLPEVIGKVVTEDEKAAREILRSLWLTITFDGAEKPQVSAPLGDFFGTGPGANLYKSLPLGMTKDGFYCYWRMPYAKEAVIKVENPRGEAVQTKWEIESVSAIPSDPIMYFHAKWRRDDPNPTFDWPFLDAVGRGRYVGVSMNVWNPRKGWWGEGDEKVWADGEKFPSWFGTGSEDYFGYAWCCNEPFVHALHNQPLCEGPGNANHSSVNRWHVADNIPFQKTYRMTIENYAKDVDYCCVTYWYATPETTDFFEVPVPPERRHVHGMAEIKSFAIPGAIEGEKMKVIEQTMGEVGPQNLEGFDGKWSQNTHRWMRPQEAGKWVDLELKAKEAGKYEMTVYLTMAGDYGIAEFEVNGAKVGKPFDAYNEGVKASGPVSLGVVELKEGKNVLRITVTGKNEKSSSYMAGLDCVVLKKM
ncbi:MAG TPA: DUF2961 domain-containing protein [Candidatus Brocadiia bacterium]|nr:DUF2961 domain-containing protein [Candidatus Brocadiia bacterium]